MTEEVFHLFKFAVATSVIHVFPHNTIAWYLPHYVKHCATKVREQNTFEREINKHIGHHQYNGKESPGLRFLKFGSNFFRF